LKFKDYQAEADAYARSKYALPLDELFQYGDDELKACMTQGETAENLVDRLAEKFDLVEADYFGFKDAVKVIKPFGRV